MVAGFTGPAGMNGCQGYSNANIKGFIVRMRTDNGAIMKYKQMSNTINTVDYLFNKVMLDDKGYLYIIGGVKNSDFSMNGISTVNDVRWSLFTMKGDIGLEDSNCLVNGVYATESFSLTWLRDTA